MHLKYIFDVLERNYSSYNVAQFGAKYGAFKALYVILETRYHLLADLPLPNKD